MGTFGQEDKEDTDTSKTAKGIGMFCVLALLCGTFLLVADDVHDNVHREINGLTAIVGSTADWVSICNTHDYAPLSKKAQQLEKAIRTQGGLVPCRISFPDSYTASPRRRSYRVWYQNSSDTWAAQHRSRPKA